jgi:biopolymer transport protein ExbD
MLVKAARADVGVSIDLTPVIDMVFLLLIFFLVATTFHQTEREMRIALPTASAAEPISQLLREFVVNVDAQGGIYVSGRQITADELADMVKQAVAANPEQKITVRGDRAATYASIVTVLDICKAGGIQEPYLDTVLEN